MFCRLGITRRFWAAIIYQQTSAEGYGYIAKELVSEEYYKKKLKLVRKQRSSTSNKEGERTSSTVGTEERAKKYKIFREWQAVPLVWSAQCIGHRRGRHEAGGEGWDQLV